MLVKVTVGHCVALCILSDTARCSNLPSNADAHVVPDERLGWCMWVACKLLQFAWETPYLHLMATKHLYMVLKCSPKLKPICANAHARKSRSQRVLGSNIEVLDVDGHGLCVQRDRENPTARCMFVGTTPNIILSFQAFRSCSFPHTDALRGWSSSSVTRRTSFDISEAFEQVFKYYAAYLDIPWKSCLRLTFMWRLTSDRYFRRHDRSDSKCVA